MAYNIKRNWYSSYMVMVKRPDVFLPFIIIAFFEALAAELIYFSARVPISLVAAPIIRKFFGEIFLHYPANLMILPKAVYYAQVVIYIFAGVFLTAISVNIFSNIKSDRPVKANALIKNAARNYLAFMLYGIVIIVLITLLQKADTFIFTKVTRVAMRFIPGIPSRISYLGLMLFMFLTNVIMQALFALTVPIMVIDGSSLIKSLRDSVRVGTRNFSTVFKLIFLPFLAYLPVTLLKSVSTPLADKTFPEMSLVVTFASIIATVFIDSFVIICVSQFLLDRAKRPEVKTP